MAEFRQQKELCNKCGRFVNTFFTYSDVDRINGTKTVNVRCVECYAEIRQVSCVKL